MCDLRKLAYFLRREHDVREPVEHAAAHVRGVEQFPLVVDAQHIGHEICHRIGVSRDREIPTWKKQRRKRCYMPGRLRGPLPCPAVSGLPKWCTHPMRFGGNGCWRAKGGCAACWALWCVGAEIGSAIGCAL